MSKIERILFLLLGGILWIYLGFRAAYVPLVHDEVVTYIAYIRDATFIPPWSYWDANNHLLNSALSAVLTNLFGNSPFAIRMASWLSFGPLLFFVFKIANQIPVIQKRWSLILPLITASYFIEFYGLTRGYGMAMAAFLGTLYLAFRYSQTPNKRNLYLMSLSGFLAALGSLSLIVAVGIIYLWILLIQTRSLELPLSRTFLRWFAICIAPLLPLVYYVLLLKDKGLLYYGGDDFIDITLKPFGELFLMTRDLWWVWIVLFTLILVLYVYRIIQNGIAFYFRADQLFAFVFFLSMFAVFTQHLILGVNFPADRAALYLWPLLVLTLVFLPLKDPLIFPNVLLLLVLWFPINLVLTANLHYSKFWVYEHVPSRFIDEVNSASNKGYPPTLNGYFLRSYIWDYAQLESVTYPSRVNGVNHPDEWADFLLVDSNRIKSVPLDRFTLVDFDSISGQSLLRQKAPNVEFFKRDTVLFDVNVENEFTNIFEFKATEWVNKPMALYFDLDVNASREVMKTLIISTVFDTNGVEVFSNKYSFSQVSENWKNKKGWKIKLYLPPFPANVGRFVTYIYNPNKEHHLFPRVECKLAEISKGKWASKPSINR